MFIKPKVRTRLSRAWGDRFFYVNLRCTFQPTFATIYFFVQIVGMICFEQLPCTFLTNMYFTNDLKIVKVCKICIILNIGWYR